jgi:uncharacterized protein YbjT (DUF2867 family)
MTLRIAVIGASRGIGQATVNEALARGHAVNGLARTPPAVDRPGLNWIKGNVLDSASLAQALDGATVLGRGEGRKRCYGQSRRQTPDRDHGLRCG